MIEIFLDDENNIIRIKANDMDTLNIPIKFREYMSRREVSSLVYELINAVHNKKVIKLHLSNGAVAEWSSENSQY